MSHPSPYGSHDAVDVASLESRLPTLLSVIGDDGKGDWILESRRIHRQVTGNLVVIAAFLVRGEPPRVSQVLAVPVFIVVGGAVWLIGKAADRRGPALVRPLLFVQLLVLTCVLTFCVRNDPALKPHGLMAMFVATIAVSAMARQFGLLRLAVPGAPSTAGMTGSLTSTVLSVLDGLARNPPLMEGPSGRWKTTLSLVVGFFAGCVAEAAGVSFRGDWAWSLPAVLAATAVALR